MVSSVSPETEHTPAKVMTVSRELPAIPVGGGRARLRCPWAVAGPGRASSRRAERSSRRGRRAGGPPPTGTTSSPAHRTARAAPGTPAAPRATQQPGTTPTRPCIQKTDIRIGCRPVVELGGFEPPTFSLRTRRATNCSIAPRSSPSATRSSGRRGGTPPGRAPLTGAGPGGPRRAPPRRLCP